MATVEIVAGVATRVAGSSSSYATARATATASFAGVYVGQARSTSFGTTYDIFRSFLKFDTSSLSGETITDVKLRLTCLVDYSTAFDFDVLIMKQDWSAYDPIGAGNRDAAYDACLAATQDDSIWRNTSGMSINTPYESGSLDTTWINTSGVTYYSLLSSRDLANSGISSDGLEYIICGSTIHGETYRPYLVVTTEGGGGSSTPIHLIRTGMQPGMRIGL